MLADEILLEPEGRRFDKNTQEYREKILRVVLLERRWSPHTGLIDVSGRASLSTKHERILSIFQQRLYKLR